MKNACDTLPYEIERLQCYANEGRFNNNGLDLVHNDWEIEETELTGDELAHAWIAVDEDETDDRPNPSEFAQILESGASNADHQGE